uniref:Uncharacterized protein n=1 Tax=Arundo donax TaxID=35708 RepID=A0A0A9DRL2_ARUDO
MTKKISTGINYRGLPTNKRRIIWSQILTLRELQIPVLIGKVQHWCVDHRTDMCYSFFGKNYTSTLPFALIKLDSRWVTFNVSFHLVTDEHPYLILSLRLEY